MAGLPFLKGEIIFQFLKEEIFSFNWHYPIKMCNHCMEADTTDLLPISKTVLDERARTHSDGTDVPRFSVSAPCDGADIPSPRVSVPWDGAKIAKLLTEWGLDGTDGSLHRSGFPFIRESRVMSLAGWGTQVGRLGN